MAKTKYLFSRRCVMTAIVISLLTTMCLPWMFVTYLDRHHPATAYHPSTKKMANKSSDSKTTNDNDSLLTYHFIVNSDCGSYQAWQVVTQLYSAFAVGQTGKFTWIVSGCNETSGHREQHQDLLSESKIRQLLSPVKGTFSPMDLVFTPDFSDMSVYGGPYADGKRRREFVNRAGKVQRGNYGNHYHFNNKPNGLLYWAKEYYNNNIPNEAIVLMDPDFLFLRTLEIFTPPAPGRPVAASYGLGAQWLDLNRTAICGNNSPCLDVTSAEVHKSYSVGPPYLIHAKDVVSLAQTWSKFTPPTYDQYPLLYAEMFAYSMAAAHLQLPHTLVKEDVYTGCMVNWPRHLSQSDLSAAAQAFVRDDDEKKKITNHALPPSSCFAQLQPPTFLHYCRRYGFPVGNTNLHKFMAKRRVPHDVLDCANVQEPLTLFTTTDKMDYSNDWTTLTACAMLRAVNYAKKQTLLQACN